jgi:hypothetical protein
VTEAGVLALGRLREAVRQKALTPFVGAGFSSAATGNAPCASWRGLLLDGIEVCEQVVSPLPQGWADRMKDHLDNADMFTYVAVADDITWRVRAIHEGRDFHSWIQTTLGGLRPTPAGKQIIEAVCRLGTLIVTTNYDALIEDQKSEGTPRTWTDSNYASANTQARS